MDRCPGNFFFIFLNILLLCTLYTLYVYHLIYIMALLSLWWSLNHFLSEQHRHSYGKWQCDKKSWTRALLMFVRHVYCISFSIFKGVVFSWEKTLFLFIVDGNFSNWSNFGVCSTICGQGTQTRTRSCTNPPPQFGGKDCVGNRIESRNCNIDRCPGIFPN